MAFVRGKIHNSISINLIYIYFNILALGTKLSPIIISHRKNKGAFNISFVTNCDRRKTDRWIPQCKSANQRRFHWLIFTLKEPYALKLIFSSKMFSVHIYKSNHDPTRHPIFVLRLFICTLRLFKELNMWFIDSLAFTLSILTNKMDALKSDWRKPLHFYNPAGFLEIPSLSFCDFASPESSSKVWMGFWEIVGVIYSLKK